MTKIPSLGVPFAPAAPDVPAVLTACHARLLEREGIAMFVAIDDARPGRALQVTDPGAIEEGARIAELFDHYYAGLAAIGFPPQFPDEPDETGAPEIIDALVVMSDQHLRARIGEVR